MDQEKEIWDRVAARINGEVLSAGEEQQVRDWLDKVPENRQLYRRLEKFYKDTAGTQQACPTDVTRAWETNRQILQSRKSRRLRRWNRYGGYAAVLIISIGLSLIWVNYIRKDSLPGKESVAQGITPGTTKAVLTLASGKNIHLETQQISIREKAGKIHNENDILQYTSLEEPGKAALEFNTLAVPRGGEYQLRLEDGTRIWVNSDTRIRYPVNFGNGERRVYLEGEAYFQVAKDSTRPFIVAVNGTEVTALGTEFNILSNGKNKSVCTTLVEGAVKVQTLRGDHCILRPRQQAVSVDTGGMTVREVKTSLYTSWKDGYYAFEQQPLEEIMSTLSRWYDIKVFYLNKEVARLRFSGRLKRYEDIDNLLTMIKLTNDVNFEMKGKTIVVRDGKNRKY